MVIDPSPEISWYIYINERIKKLNYNHMKVCYVYKTLDMTMTNYLYTFY